MNARELHDKLSRSGANPDLAEFCAGHATILRALDLLAHVEESEDELVRMCEAASRDERLADGMLYRKAAAALVALKAERDELKRHAEAMAEELQWIACRYDDSKSTRECAADAYEMKSAAAQALHAYRAAQEKP